MTTASTKGNYEKINKNSRTGKEPLGEGDLDLVTFFLVPRLVEQLANLRRCLRS